MITCTVYALKFCILYYYFLQLNFYQILQIVHAVKIIEITKVNIPPPAFPAWASWNPLPLTSKHTATCPLNNGVSTEQSG